MTESKQKAVELVKDFSTLVDAIKCVEEIIANNENIKRYLIGGGVVFDNTIFWQEVLTHLKEML